MKHQNSPFNNETRATRNKTRMPTHYHIYANLLEPSQSGEAKKEIVFQKKEIEMSFIWKYINYIENNNL